MALSLQMSGVVKSIPGLLDLNGKYITIGGVACLVHMDHYEYVVQFDLPVINATWEFIPQDPDPDADPRVFVLLESFTSMFEHMTL